MATQRKPIGLALPIQNGSGGFFDQTYDTYTQTRMNIINLLRTKIGERRMQPAFGSRLWNVAFEQNVEILDEIIKNIVKEDVARWVPGVSVKNVEIKVPENDGSSLDVDIYTLYVYVTFEVAVTQEQGTVELILNRGKI